MNNESELLYTSDDELPSLVDRLISTNREATYWDFKQIWHENKADLVHDIICLANNPKGNVGLLIFGVADSGNHELFDVEGHSEYRKNTQQMTDLLRACQWLTTFPYVRVVPIQYCGSCIDVLLIEPDDEAIPYRLAKDYEATEKSSSRGAKHKRKVVRAGVIYSRNGDSNTPINSTVDSVLSEKLWRRHFGLDKTPLERVALLLRDPSKWKETLNTVENIGEEPQNCYYHEDFPEFVYIRRFIDDGVPGTDKYEYFMLASPFPGEPQWCYSRIYYHQTMLFETAGAFSDHLYIPSPKAGFIRKDDRSHSIDNVIMYGYFVEHSIEKSLLDFMLDESKEGSTGEETEKMLFKLLPLFVSEGEHISFERWCESRWEKVHERISSHECLRLAPESAPPRIAETLTDKARASEVLVELLEEFRSLTPGARLLFDAPPAAVIST